MEVKKINFPSVVEKADLKRPVEQPQEISTREVSAYSEDVNQINSLPKGNAVNNIDFQKKDDSPETAPNPILALFGALASIAVAFSGGSSHDNETMNACVEQLHKAAAFIEKHGTQYSTALFLGPAVANNSDATRRAIEKQREEAYQA